ncbi:MAG: HDOD domain-containing protein [Nitrospinaceae bacterium]
MGEKNKFREKIISLLHEKDDLPPLPDILLKLEKRISDPDSEIEEIAGLIETEPVLSGRLIKLANSVLFAGGREEAQDLPSTVLRLGLKMVLDLAYTLHLPKMFNQARSFNQILFWRHSLTVACLTQILAERVELSREEREESYVCGLMHDLGIVVFDYLIPVEYKEFIQGIGPDAISLADLEKEKFGTAHPELGAAFIRKKWSLSSVVVRGVSGHIFKLSMNGSGIGIAQVVGMADQIANKFEVIHGILPGKERPLDDKIFEILKMSQDELEEIMQNTLEGVNNAESLLNG